MKIIKLMYKINTNVDNSARFCSGCGKQLTEAFVYLATANNYSCGDAWDIDYISYNICSFLCRAHPEVYCKNTLLADFFPANYTPVSAFACSPECIEATANKVKPELLALALVTTKHRDTGHYQHIPPEILQFFEKLHYEGIYCFVD